MYKEATFIGRTNANKGRDGHYFSINLSLMGFPTLLNIVPTHKEMNHDTRRRLIDQT